MSDTTKDTTPKAGATQTPGAPETGATGGDAQKPTKLFMGGDNTPAADDEVSRLKADLQRHKVEEGRVKSLAEQLKAKDAEIESMRLKVEAAEKAKVRPLADFVDPSRRKIVDEDILLAQEDMIRGSQQGVLEEIERRVGPLQKTLEAERAARAQVESASFDAQIEQLHQGFAAETNPGGKFVDKWTEYLGQVDRRTGLKNGEILSNAYGARRLDGVSDMIADFKAFAGVSRMEDVRGSAFPGRQTQFASPGSGRTDDKRRYTMSQYKAELAQAREAFERGRITQKERVAVLEKFKTAASEGRIVNDPAPQVGV